MTVSAPLKAVYLDGRAVDESAWPPAASSALRSMGMGLLQDRVAIVTGAGSVLGKATAIRFVLTAIGTSPIEGGKPTQTGIGASGGWMAH